MSAETERARVLLDNARAALDREGQLLDVVGALTDQVRQLWHDLAELRDEHVALSQRLDAVTTATSAELRTLSNRIESVTRGVSGLHSVQS